MLVICKVKRNGPYGGVANVQERQRLDKLREELMMPWGELNRLVEIVVSRKVDARLLTMGESRKMVEFMRVNRLSLTERCRKMVWNS